MTSAVATRGTTLSWNSQTVAEINKIGGVSLATDTIDVTHYTSTDAIREFIAGFSQYDDIEIEGSFIAGDTNGQIAMIADQKAGTVREVIITAKDSLFTWTFDAMLVKCSVDSSDMNGQHKFSATLKPSGSATLGVTQEDQLSDLTFTTATLVPAFNAAKYSYTANTTGTSVTVTPTCAGADSITVYADGVLISTLASGETSAAIAITTAANVEVEIRCNGTGKVSRVYKATLFKSA